MSANWRWSLLVGVGCLALACTDDASGTDSGVAADGSIVSGDVSAADAGGTGADALADATTPSGLPVATGLFEPSGVHTVAITLAAPDWADLLNTAKDPAAPRTFHLGEVTIDGTVYHQVGLRVFGQGSMVPNPVKPNVRLKFDQFDTALRGPGKHNNLRLKAGGGEATFLREALAFDAFAGLAGAGLQHSYARVTVNGQLMGLYQLTEQPDKDTMQRVTGSKPTKVYEPLTSCVGLNCLGTNCQALKTVYDLKDGDFAEVTALALAIRDTPDAGLAAELDKRMGLDNLMGVYAAESVLSEMDGLASSGMNYTLFDDPKTGKLHVLRSGADEVMSENYALLHPFGPPNTNCPNRNDELLTRILAIPELKAKYVAALLKAHCTVLEEGKILSYIDKMKPLLLEELSADPLTLYKGQDFVESIYDLRGWLHARHQLLDETVGVCP